MRRDHFLLSVLTARMVFLLPEMVLLVLVGKFGFGVPLRSGALALLVVIVVGASAFSTFVYLTLPHLARPITVVILIETIFLLTVFAEIFVTTGGGPGLATTNIAFLIYSQALVQYDVGNASAGGLVAVVIANIVAFFLVRIVGRNLET